MLQSEHALQQVKTHVAITIVKQHSLEQRQKVSEHEVAEWMRKAELAVEKKQDHGASTAVQRVEIYREQCNKFAQQITDQKAQVETLKTAKPVSSL